MVLSQNIYLLSDISCQFIWKQFKKKYVTEAYSLHTNVDTIFKILTNVVTIIKILANVVTIIKMLTNVVTIFKILTNVVTFLKKMLIVRRLT